MKKLYLIGQIFHYLTVIEEAEPIKGRRAWKCQCKCGNIKNVKQDDLRAGDTKSCGCWNNIQRSARAKDMYSVIIKYTPQEASARRVWSGRYGEMPFEDFFELSQQNCKYCGEFPSNYSNPACGANSSEDMRQNGYFTHNGLDRINNDLPHSKENCVPCCKYCNYAKRERTTENFNEWICKVYHFWANQYDKTNT